MAFQLKVTLNESNPVIWRRLLVPGNFTFGQLHVAIQVAMGWSDSHLYAFMHPEFPSRQIGWSPEDDMEEDMEDAELIDLAAELTKEGMKMHYVYDFGDDWMHTVLVEKVAAQDPELPICMAGGGACPPEDCGGIHQYYHIVKHVNDPKSSEGKEHRDWLDMEDGELWDLNHFDVEDVNKAFKMVFDE